MIEWIVLVIVIVGVVLYAYHIYKKNNEETVDDDDCRFEYKKAIDNVNFYIEHHKLTKAEAFRRVAKDMGIGASTVSSYYYRKKK